MEDEGEEERKEDLGHKEERKEEGCMKENRD